MYKFTHLALRGCTILGRLKQTIKNRRPSISLHAASPKYRAHYSVKNPTPLCPCFCRCWDCSLVLQLQATLPHLVHVHCVAGPFKIYLCASWIFCDCALFFTVGIYNSCRPFHPVCSNLELANSFTFFLSPRISAKIYATHRHSLNASSCCCL